MRDLPELPAIKDATVGTLRLEGTLAKRLPSMPSGELQDLYFTDVRRQEAEKYAQDMKNVFHLSRTDLKRSQAISRAKNRRAQKQAERR